MLSTDFNVKVLQSSSESTPDLTSRSNYIFINILLLMVKLSIHNFELLLVLSLTGHSVGGNYHI